MGRPRKDSGEADVRTRIVEAFWDVLETHQLDEISVGMITSKAGCNRGTFYYHFADRNALIQAVIQDEIAEVPQGLFRFIAGLDESPLKTLGEDKIKRMRLMMEHGGNEEVAEAIKHTVMGMWQAVLCPNGEELNPDTRVILEYMLSGALGIMRIYGNEGTPATFDQQLTDWIRDNSATGIRHVYIIEGITRDELMRRVQMASTVMALAPGSTSSRKTTTRRLA
jgi:AcrR family transcriptional regulator